jgi:hypothetical protein
MKKCYKCQKIKDFPFFYKNSCKKDGYTSICKGCKKIEDKKYRAKNKKQIKEYQQLVILYNIKRSCTYDNKES